MEKVFKHKLTCAMTLARGAWGFRGLRGLSFAITETLGALLMGRQGLWLGVPCPIPSRGRLGRSEEREPAAGGWSPCGGGSGGAGASRAGKPAQGSPAQ